jgi:hypothetical protein
MRALILAAVGVTLYALITWTGYVASRNATAGEFSTLTLVLVAMLWPVALVIYVGGRILSALRWCLSDG